MASITWQGTKELNAALKRIVNEFPRERNMFLRQTAENLKSRAVRHTPVDTGLLRNSWQVGEPAGGSIEVGNTAEYSAFVEFGHRTRGGSSFVPGQFFLRSAVDESREQFVADASLILARLFR